MYLKVVRSKYNLEKVPRRKNITLQCILQTESRLKFKWDVQI